jgi:hypothetical protein
MVGYDVWAVTPGAQVLCGGKGRPQKRRNKIAGNSLKTNDPTKSSLFAPNDFKDLQGGVRNVFFRLAKGFDVWRKVLNLFA